MHLNLFKPTQHCSNKVKIPNMKKAQITHTILLLKNVTTNSQMNVLNTHKP